MKNIKRTTLEVYGFQMGAPAEGETLTVTKEGYCKVHVKFIDAEKTNYDMFVWTDQLPRKVSADVFIDEFNSKMAKLNENKN